MLKYGRAIAAAMVQDNELIGETDEEFIAGLRESVEDIRAGRVRRTV
jgi:hypothetical protein